MLFGYGYGYLTLWMSEDVFLNNENSVNISAVYGSQGLLALSPSGLVGTPAGVFAAGYNATPAVFAAGYYAAHHHPAQ